MRFNCPFHTRHPPIKLHLHPLVCIFELFQSRKYSTLIWECHSSVSQPTAALERALVGNRSSVLSGQVATSVRLCGRLRDRCREGGKYQAAPQATASWLLPAVRQVAPVRVRTHARTQTDTQACMNKNTRARTHARSCARTHKTDTDTPRCTRRRHCSACVPPPGAAVVLCSPAACTAPSCVH